MEKEQLMIQSIPHHLSNMVEAISIYGCQWNQVVMFINELIANKSSRKNSEVYRTKLFRFS